MASCVIVEPDSPDPTVTEVSVYLSSTSSSFDKIELELVSIKFSQMQVTEWSILSEDVHMLNLEDLSKEALRISDEEVADNSIYNLKLDFGTENYMYSGTDKYLLQLDMLEETDLIVNVNEELIKGEKLEIQLEIDADGSVIEQQGTDVYFFKPILRRK